MNEKIKELAIQTCDQIEWDKPHEPFQSLTFTPQTMQKFAELIILECSELCYNSKLKDSDAHAMNILDHFNIDGAKSWK